VDDEVLRSRPEILAKTRHGCLHHPTTDGLFQGKESFVMTTQQEKVTSELIVQLAQERTLSTVFEKSWEEKMGVNPVVMMIKMRRRESDKHAWDVLVYSSVVISIYLAGLFFVFGTLVHDGVNTADRLVSILAVIPFVYIVFLGIRWKNKNPPIQYNADEFLADLNALCEWLSPKFLSADILLSSNERVVKFAVHGLLVSEAISLVKIEQEKKGKDAAENMARICQMDMARRSFTIKHNTLARLGLVSGGFGEYFYEAKRQVKKTKVVEAVPATE
jgi:hypothetical protein